MSRVPSRTTPVERRSAMRRRAAGWFPSHWVSPWLVVSAFAVPKMTAAHGLIFAGLAATALASTLFLVEVGRGATVGAADPAPGGSTEGAGRECRGRPGS